MYTAKVIGTVVCTRKDPSLDGKKLLVVQVIENGKPTKKIVALDGIGMAGEGDWVYLIGGREAALPFGKMTLTPTEATIVGFVDTLHVDPRFDKPPEK